MQLTKLNSEMAAVGQVLEHYKSKFEALEARQAALDGAQADFDKRFERQKADQTRVKARVGTTEMKIKDIEEILDDNALSKIDVNTKRTPVKSADLHSDPKLYFEDQIQKLQRRVTEGEISSAATMKEIKSKVEVLTAAVEADQTPAVTRLSRAASPAMSPPRTTSPVTESPTATRTTGVGKDSDMKGDIVSHKPLKTSST